MLILVTNMLFINQLLEVNNAPAVRKKVDLYDKCYVKPVRFQPSVAYEMQVTVKKYFTPFSFRPHRLSYSEKFQVQNMTR